MDAVINIRADVKNALRGIDNLNRRVDSIQRSAKRSAQAIGSLERATGRLSGILTAAAAAFAGFATQRGISGIIQSTKAFEGYRAQLTAYLGSQKLANYELGRLEKLATGLPQTLNELTDGFVRLNRAGISTTNESMKAFANIASANNKTMGQLAEALADAVTGEYERLKEFGVKVTRENGQLMVKMGDQMIGVANSGSEVAAIVEKLGQEGGKYFGAAESQANTLTGALSRLEDATTKAQKAIGERGFAKALSDVADSITKFIEKNDDVITQISQGLTKALLVSVEAMKLVYKNIGLIGKAFIAFFALKVGLKVIAIATALAGPLYKALKLAATGVLFLSKAIIRNPLFAIGAGIALAIGKVTGALDYLYDAVVGLGKEAADGAGDALIKTFESTKNLILDNIEGGNEFAQAMQDIDDKAKQYGETAKQNLQTLTDQEAAAENSRNAIERATAAEQAKKEQAQQVVDAYIEQLRVSALTKDEQELINVLKDIEQKTGISILNSNGEILEQERERVDQIQNQIDKQKELNFLKEQEIKYVKRVTDDVTALVNEAFAPDRYKAEIKTLQTIADSAKEFVESTKDMQIYSAQEIADAKLFIEQDLQRKINDIEFKAIRYRLSLQKNAIAQQLSATDKATLQRIGQEERQQQIVADRIEFEKKSDTEKAQWAIQQGASVFEALGAQNKKAFEATKALNIANAIMNTYAAATKALATYPWPFGLIAATAAVAAGMAQVSAIRSQQYSGRALGGPVMGNQPYIVGENGPELFTPSTTGRITRNSELTSGGDVNINFNITANDSQGFDDLLVQRRGLITQMISDAMVERGQRSMV